MAVDFDAILEDVADFGRYQKMIVFLLCVPACFMNAFGWSFVFAGYTPDYYCVLPDYADRTADYRSDTDRELYRACAYTSRFENGTIHFQHQCSNFTYDQTYFTATVVTEWDLVCDKSIHTKLMMSIHSLVTLAGCLINSYFQDIFGRKKSFLIVLTLNLIGGIASAFAPNFLVYAILRSLVAYGTTSAWNVTYTWALEYVGPRRRSMVTMIFCVFYGVAAVSVGGVAWLCNSWRKLTLAGSVPFISLYSYAFIIDESPRWLLSKGRKEEALKTVRKIAKWEKKTLNDEIVRKLLHDDEEETASDDEEQETATDDPAKCDDNGQCKVECDRRLTGDNFGQCKASAERLRAATADATAKRRLNGGTKGPAERSRSKAPAAERSRSKAPAIQDLFRTRNLRWKTVLLTYCWVANLLTYLAITYNMENLKGNLFLTYTLQAAIEIPASLLIVFLLDRYGRIPPLSVSMVACGVLLFITVPADWLDGPWIVVSLTLAAKFGITLSFSILVQLAGESYPTQLRGLGTGFSSFVGTLGSTVMPYVVHSAQVYKMLPMILMGTTAVTSGISVLMLPETKGRYMPETIEEAEGTEKVGCNAMTDNWRNMTCRRKRDYKPAVVSMDVLL